MNLKVIQISDINLLALAVLVTIFISSNTGVERKFYEYKIFMGILLSVMITLILEVLCFSLDGVAGDRWYTVNRLAHSLFFAFNPIPPLLWVAYVDMQLNNDKQRTKKIFKVLLLPTIIIIIISLLSFFTSWAFIIDTNNLYIRTNFVYFNTAICFTYILISIIFVILKWGKVDNKTFLSFMLFPIPPFIGGFLQILNYGVVSIWAGVTVAVLLTFITIQNRKMNTDPLTGLYNRRQLNDYLDKKINETLKGNTFSLIMIDIDDFKLINDNYGHAQGDYYLEKTAKIIKDSFRVNDFIARYGGDEFIVILDIQNREQLKARVNMIKDKLAEYNKSSKVQLNLSIGYDIYDKNVAQKSNDYFMYIDQLMYDDKKRKKELQYT